MVCIQIYNMYEDLYAYTDLCEMCVCCNKLHVIAISRAYIHVYMYIVH